MRGDVGVGVLRKPVDAGTAWTAQEKALALGANARAHAPHLLPRSFAKGDALLHRGRQGAGELRCVVPQGVIACLHSGVEARFQIPELPQCADDTSADFLDHGGDVRVGRWLTLHKTWLEVLVGAIEIDPLEEDAFEIFPPPAR